MPSAKTMLRPGLLVLAVLGLASLEVSCGQKCLVADQADVLDTRDGLYLVFRVTGFQDKAEYFEVYRSKPEFDVCGSRSSEAPPMATAFYERREGLLKGVELRDSQLEIIYTHNPSEAIKPREARLSRRS